MMLIVPRDLVELLAKGSNPRVAVHELAVSVPLVVPSRRIDDACTDSQVDVAGDLQGSTLIFQPLGPGILIKCPEHLPWLADYPTDAVVQHGFGVAKVMEDPANTP